MYFVDQNIIVSVIGGIKIIKLFLFCTSFYISLVGYFFHRLLKKKLRRLHAFKFVRFFFLVSVWLSQTKYHF